MAGMKLYGKDLSSYEDIDLDDLLNKLSPEELEELGQELIDPDDSCIPPSDRCRYKTDKAPTGPFNRKHLLDFIEKKAREEKDWEEAKPFSKEIRGKIWKPKEEAKVQLNEDEEVETEWDEVLASATEEELVDLAAILGFHGMLNQVQYHKAFISGDADESETDTETEDEDGETKKKKKVGGFQGIAKHETFKMVEPEPPNTTDVDDALTRLKDNDPKLTEINLNNIKNISTEQLVEFGEALKDNTHLEKFHLSNTKATDRVAKAIAESLEDNKTLKILNMESNYISGEAIVELLEAINENETLVEFRIANQRPQVLGVKIETRITDLIMENKSLLRFGIFMETSNGRVKVMEAIQRNNDSIRIERVGTGKVNGEA